MGIARARGGVAVMSLTYPLICIKLLIRNKTFGFEGVSASKMRGLRMGGSDPERDQFSAGNDAQESRKNFVKAG